MRYTCIYIYTYVHTYITYIYTYLLYILYNCLGMRKNFLELKHYLENEYSASIASIEGGEQL